MKRKGFSIIELIAIMLIIGIMSVVGFVALDPYKGIKLDAATKKIATDIEYAQSLSISTSRWHGIKFYPALQVVPITVLKTGPVYYFESPAWAQITPVTIKPVPLKQNQYEVYETDGTTDTIIENPAKLGANFIVKPWRDLGRVKIKSINIGGGRKVEFSPLGVPYNDKNGSAITTTGVITIEYSGLTRMIEITPDSGRISIP